MCLGATPSAPRFWRRDQVPQPVARRMEQLDAIEELIRRGVPTANHGNWDNPEALRMSSSQLEERVRAARELYREILVKAGRPQEARR